MQAKLLAELIGTFWLVLGGCGSAVLAAAFPNVGIGLLGVSFAFGLTVVTGAYALGPISGGHFNPAVSIGLWAGGRFPAKGLLPYIAAQVVGGIVGAGVLYLIASGKAGFDLAGGFASKRLRRPLSRQVFPDVGAGHRDRHDLHVPHRDPRRDPWPRRHGVRRARHRFAWS
jgi:glycerol uptake facilitator-like aquaporin